MWATAAGRLTISLALLWLVARFVDVGGVGQRLSELRPGWVVVGLMISVLQVGVLAWRWRFTAVRLGIDLPLREAVLEYYLGIFLNQVLPGGITGDVSRAWRHARSEAEAGPAVRAVILERASAQVVMTLVAVGSVLLLPWASGPLRVTVAVAAAIVVGLMLRSAARRPGEGGAVAPFWTDAHQALFTAEARVPQLATAVAVVGSYIVVFLVAMRAVGVETPLWTVLPLVAPVLMTMLIPVTVAGWGIREGAAVALWGVVGLTPEDGAAISVAYGLLVLVSSTPGLIVLMAGLSGGRGRRAHPPQG